MCRSTSLGQHSMLFSREACKWASPTTQAHFQTFAHSKSANNPQTKQKPKVKGWRRVFHPPGHRRCLFWGSEEWQQIIQRSICETEHEKSGGIKSGGIKRVSTVSQTFVSGLFSSGLSAIPYLGSCCCPCFPGLGSSQLPRHPC